MGRLARLVADTDLGTGTPIGIAAAAPDGEIEEFVSGAWPIGEAVAKTDCFYVASLAKQLTGVAAALLVRDGALDPDAPISSYLRDLPAWSSVITPRQLAHHTAGLPAAGEFESQLGGGDRTRSAVFAALAELRELRSPSGTAFSYSNVGYVLLAAVAEEVAGESFAAFVGCRLLRPFGIGGMSFAGPAARDFLQTELMGPSLPLTVGDGGLWSTPRAFAQWLDLQNRDGLDVAPIVQSPAHLRDGTETDYGWGVGIRTFRDRPLFIHGGEWTGAFAKAARCPALGIAVVAMAAGPSIEVLNALVDATLADLSDAG